MDYLGTEAIPTSPKENPTPEILSALRFPDWVENTIGEEKRQEAAINQFYKIEEDEIANYEKFLENGEIEDDGDFIPAELDRELNQLLEINEDIEV